MHSSFHRFLRFREAVALRSVVPGQQHGRAGQSDSVYTATPGPIGAIRKRLWGRDELCDRYERFMVRFGHYWDDQQRLQSIPSVGRYGFGYS